LPQNRRFLVALLGIWQPIGVVVASAIAFGTAAKFRCDVELPACSAAGVNSGDACCTVSSNMGWRYEVIIIGVITFIVFIARYLVFTFHESPKFLISKGRDQEAIDVLRKIARFNKAPMPTLSLEDLQLIDANADTYQRPKDVKQSLVERFGFLRGLFLSRLQCFSFFLLAIAYMVSRFSDS
jgi:MFS family permease